MLLSSIASAPSRAALAAVGVADSLSAKHDRAAVVAAPGVLANDLNLLGGATAILTSDVSHGELDLRSNGGYTYTPDPGYVGSDSFRYRPSGVLSTAAKVTITVTNAQAVARADAYSTPSRTTLAVPAPGVLANDTDAEGDALEAEIDQAGGISGSLDLESNGALEYSPGGGFSGSVSFTYRVWDGIAWSPPATVTLTVAAATPTPSPTPAPPPTPPPLLPLPLPSLPLPSLPLPLPPLPVPLPSIGLLPDPQPEPTEPPASPRPRSSPDTSAGADGGLAPPGSDSDDDQPGDGSVAGPRAVPGGRGTEGGLPAPAENEATVSLAFDEAELDVGTVDIDLLTGIDVWSVPAATLGVPGLLLIVWVMLQAAGALAWIPAVRRLRGDEEPAP
jgi:hypothetical protein